MLDKIEWVICNLAYFGNSIKFVTEEFILSVVINNGD